MELVEGKVSRCSLNKTPCISARQFLSADVSSLIYQKHIVCPREESCDGTGNSGVH